ncbi:UNVERIFIED_CONTAM: Beta-D-glucosyl crocetin beta-1,6-glucosyltransferase [Sesamum radiatum]|uniref:Beta-D-glucosyl crocetin beta-1,6-glucosyltransferase n=1 Tax=Sesamum radiatum TaxID=300843 RepID=A0AAW2UDI1_SESRA
MVSSWTHISFLELAKRLSRRNFSIYLCSTAINLDSIRTNTGKDVSDDPSIQLVELHIPPSSELPPELHTTKNLPSNLLPTLIQALQMSSFSFSNIMNSVNPDVLIYDFFQPWAPKLASSKGLPSVFFSSASATLFAFYHHLYMEGDSSTFPYQAIYLLDHEKTNFRAHVVPYLKDAEEDFAFGNFKLSTDIIMMKSSRAIEGSISIIYQIEVIAKGLGLCNVNFLWVVRFPIGEKSSIEEALPAGFLETVKDRGIVVPGWAPQTKILAHPSTGGFVSGWGLSWRVGGSFGGGVGDGDTIWQKNW